MSTDDLPEIDGELIEEESSALTLAPAPLDPIMNPERAKERLAIFQTFVKQYLVEDEDFGTIPGTQKPTLYKSGADKLCEVYGLVDDYEEIRSVIDWERGLFDYEYRCILTRKGRVITRGIGSCSSFESRYRYREAERRCPECGVPAIIKGKKQYGGGWVCFKKKGGCGAKFSDEDHEILKQAVGRIQNPDIYDLKNTVIKMAKKRAKLDATLSATRSSGIFTQDVEADEEGAPEIVGSAKPEAGKPAAAGTAAPASASQDATRSDDGFISEDERRKVFAAASRANVGHDDLKKYLIEMHNTDSTRKMSRAIADDVLKFLNSVEQAAKNENESGS